MSVDKNTSQNLSGKIIGAAIEVHRTLKAGFIESIYHNALKHELQLKGIPYETEKTIKVYYKGEQVGEHRVDLLVNKEIIIELKTVSKIKKIHQAQIMSYLKASNIHLGLILNFSKSRLEIKRVANDYQD
jgi:GxxExxY protein